MDKLTLKSLIIELKDNGHTFQAISDILREEYGIDKSRQAVCGLYNRAVSKTEDSTEDLVLKSDIINFYCLGYSNEQIRNIFSDKEVSLHKIHLALEDNNSIIEKTNEQIGILKELMKVCTTAEILKKSLEYKDQSITDNRFKELMITLISDDIQLKIKDLALELGKITEDTLIAKRIAKFFNIELTTKDIRKIKNNSN